MNSPASKLQSASPAARHRRRIATVVFFGLVLLILLLLARPVATHLRAVALLLRIENPQDWGTLARFGTYPIEEKLIEVPTPAGPVRARLYIPQGIANAPAMVIVHGVHHLGIDEPRLVAFARAMSAGGIRVLTPELSALADYRIDSSSIDLIGYSARSLSTDTGQKVGLLGISFGGGLSLIAAARPQYAPYIGFVVSVGAHDDLERVSQFLITNTITRPDGTTLAMQAHEYGPLILIYSHLDEFFPPADIGAAHEALQLLLWEKVDESKKAAEQLSPPSREKFKLLYNHDVDALAGEMKQSIVRHQAEMAPASPHGQLGSLRAPVLLLHGAADNVIPPSEMLWLQHDIPSGLVKDALITPALSHASIDGKPSLADNLRLVHFMAKLLELSDLEFSNKTTAFPPKSSAQ
ncbi:MAG: alpha/beta hydrolase [Terriglobales bacterium]